MNTGKIEYSRRLPAKVFYDQLRTFLEGTGVEKAWVDQAILNAIYLENHWPQPLDPQNETLLERARRLVALKFGGRIPQGVDFPRFVRQNKGALITRWINGENLDYSLPITPKKFYDQVRGMLEFLGANPAKVDAQILQTIHSERQWHLNVEKEKDTLLERVRRLVARYFGGAYPFRSEIPGVPSQAEHSTLTRWLKGEKISHSSKTTAKDAYEQIESLLLGMGEDPNWIEPAIIQDVFVSRNWNLPSEPERDSVLDRARRLVAKRFRGYLPQLHGLPSVPKQRPLAPLSRWVLEGLLPTPKNCPLENFYPQVRALLVGLGEDPTEVERLLGPFTVH